MISLNLLEETRVQTARTSGGSFAMPRVKLAAGMPAFMLGGALAVAAGMLAIWGMLLIKDRADLDARIEKARTEQARLEHVLGLEAALRGKKQELNRRIGVIADLKQMSDLPVHLLDLVSESLANFVWLEEVTSTGELVTIHGRAETPFALANFLRNLEESPYFADVAMGQLQNEEASGQTRFDVTMTYKPGSSPSGLTARGKEPSVHHPRDPRTRPTEITISPGSATLAYDARHEQRRYQRHERGGGAGSARADPERFTGASVGGMFRLQPQHDRAEPRGLARSLPRAG